MPDVSFTNLLIVAAVAVLAPLTVGFAPRLRIPAVVLEIIGGIIIGPSGLGWVHVDLPVAILALFGLAFLLFLAERGGRQRDRDQQRLRHPAERLERRAGAVAQDQADQVAEHGEAEQTSAQAVHVDLQPGQEEQEGQAEQGQDRHRQVNVDPAEPGRPDDDAADDLEHDRRDAQPRREADRQRGKDGDGGDHEQVGKGHVRHDCSARS